MTNDERQTIMRLQQAIREAEALLLRLQSGGHQTGRKGVPTKRDLMTVREVADMLVCSSRTIQRRLQSGELAGVKDGKRVLIHRWSVDAFIQALRSL